MWEDTVNKGLRISDFPWLAQFRGVQIGQILYGGDDLGGDFWDNRDWESRWEVREQLIWLAAEACLLL